MTSAVATIEELVRVVAEQAAHGEMKASERIEALRVLAPYYVALKKGKFAVLTEEADSKVTITGLQNAVRQAESGNGRAVPDHRRRTRGSEVVNG